MVLATLVFILPLTACKSNTTSKVTSAPKTQQINNSQSAVISRNKKIWKKEIKDIPVVKTNQHGDNRGKISSSLSELTKVNGSVIKGTIVNLTRMDNAKNVALTKSTIHVDSVISGDKKLQGKNIQMALNSGITTTSSWYADKNQTREAEHDILVQYAQAPLPAIGSKIIVGMKLADKSESSPYNKSLKQSGFDYKKTYVAAMPELNLWIKNSGEKDFHLNNPATDKRLKSDIELKQEITKLTQELNQKYNK